jgi:hypothetical protein
MPVVDGDAINDLPWGRPKNQSVICDRIGFEGKYDVS